MNDDEITDAQHTAVTVVRVTPLRADGHPDHQWAMTYHLDEPVLAGIGIEECLPSFTRSPEAGVCLDYMRRRYVGALVAADEHPQHRDIGAIAQGIWQRRRTGAAVETRAEAGPGTWWYTLVPWWRHRSDTDRWPLKGLPGHHVYALGDCLLVDGYTWPRPAPLPNPQPLNRGTQLILAETTIAPPAPGFPPYTGAAA
ncbi:hypothetical protein ABZ568_00900 [Streptomyces olindensis]|uniref:Uncharacterized protein n=1 Tax=Streptomyces olindensis TaxID=358823 RepID=A0ABV2XLY8_9ACTN